MTEWEWPPLSYGAMAGEIAHGVAQCLDQVAGLMSDRSRETLVQTAEAIRTQASEGWDLVTCQRCPVCDQVVCVAECALARVRVRAELIRHLRGTMSTRFAVKTDEIPFS